MADDDTPFQINLSKLLRMFGPSFGGAQGTTATGGGSSPGGTSGQPDPDNPLKPGPWDPVIRTAVKEVMRFGPAESWRHGPQPEPWLRAAFGSDLLDLIGRRFPAVFDTIGGTRRPGDEVSLNPQPLPPRYAVIHALGEALVTRAELLAEVGNASGDPQSGGNERGIIIVGGYVNRLVDEFCGTGFRLRWPFPGPPPPWFSAEIGGRDLLTLAASLDSAASEAFDPSVKQALGEASAKLAQAGVERMG